jgi:hypothetical protein
MTSSQSPEPYSHRLRLAEQAGRAREVLAAGQETPGCEGLAAYTGRLEALLKMLAGSAEQVLDGQS